MIELKKLSFAGMIKKKASYTVAATTITVLFVVIVCPLEVH